MKKVAAIFLCAVFLAVFAGTSFALDKFAYIDVDKVASEYNKFKEYDKIMTDKRRAADKELEAKTNEIKQYEEKLAMLSENERAKKRDEWETKYKAYQDFAMQKGIELRKWWDEKMLEVSKDIETEVAQYSQKEGFTLVFNRIGVFYRVNTLDISDKIITILNNKYVKK